MELDAKTEENGRARLGVCMVSLVPLGCLVWLQSSKFNLAKLILPNSLICSTNKFAIYINHYPAGGAMFSFCLLCLSELVVHLIGKWQCPLSHC